MQKRAIQLFVLSVFLLMFVAVAPFTIFAATAPQNHTASASVTNPYSPAYQHSYRHGVTPTIEQLGKMKSYEQAHPNAIPAVSSNTLSYGGGIDGIGVTSGHEKVYLVFWGTQWGTQSTDSSGNLTFSNDTAGGAPRLQNMFKGLGTGNELWSGVMTQYCDGSGVSSGATSCPASALHVGYPTGGALSGVWYDNSAASPSAATGHQIGQEAVNAASHFGNTTSTSNRYAQYVILSPKGANPDNYKTGGFCAWHDYNGDSTLTGGAVSSPYGDIAFTNMPYVMDQGTSCGQNFVNSGTAGTVDGYTMVEGHEYSETITDQNPAGGWTNTSSGQENADECAWISPGSAGGAGNVTMGNGSYAEQATWSNDTSSCALSHAIIGGGTPTPTPTTGTTPTPTPTTGITPTPTSTPTSGGLTNGGFETGSFSGWTTAGTTSISSTAHSGSYSGEAGSTAATNGDSSISQTFTVPSGYSGLSFWYQVYCPDTVTYDWATATLKDNTSGTTTTILAKTCNTSATWTRVSASITSGHSYTLTLTSHDDNYAGDATYTLFDDVALSASATNPVTNPGFETGSFSGWTTAGTTSISSTAHSGSYSGEAGSTAATNGDSSISQTFTISSGSTLSFWYRVYCPDTVTYDWATATLKDNTSGTTTTILAKTCNTSATWVQVSASITSGHSYTLTLTSHDDNYAGDATYTLFDDVAVN